MGSHAGNRAKRTNEQEQALEALNERMSCIMEADPSMTATLDDQARFLRANDYDVHQSFIMMMKFFNWRSTPDYGVESVAEITAETVENEIKADKAVLLDGMDKCGRPIVHVKVKNHDKTDRDIEELTRFTIFMLNQAVEKMESSPVEGTETLTILFDLKGVGWQNVDFQFVKRLVYLLSRFYPERAGLLLLVNAPGFFQGAWGVIKGWLDEVTANKVVFSNTEDALKYIDEDVLPVEWQEQLKAGIVDGGEVEREGEEEGLEEVDWEKQALEEVKAEEEALKHEEEK